jgi:hypothetical protein
MQHCEAKCAVLRVNDERCGVVVTVSNTLPRQGQLKTLDVRRCRLALVRSPQGEEGGMTTPRRTGRVCYTDETRYGFVISGGRALPLSCRRNRDFMQAAAQQAGRRGERGC